MKNTDAEFYAAAISNAESGDLNGALENINRAIELNSIELNYLIYLGFIKYSLGDHVQAIAAYDKYLSYNPNSQSIWINRNIVSQSSGSTTSLELGCGVHHKNPFNARESYGIDIREDLDLNIYKADLAIEKIPFPDNHFDFVVAEHFIEHIPRLIYSPNHRFPFIELMSEIWRVLKPKGLFYAITPAYPHVEAFQDPTHVNIITERTFPAYFCYAVPWAQQYGFKGRFNFTKQDWEGPCLRTWLNKID